MSKWYHWPDEHGAPVPGDVVVARSEGIAPRVDATVQWIGVILRCTGNRDWNVSAADANGQPDHWISACIRRPTEAEMVTWALMGPTVPELVDHG